ncbi:MAG: anti-sigma factor domain-containing protein, partial [Clostridia bacterium]|nr:anti-sigma factor domain-containing protein [Clostridia bacterium]
MRGVIMSVEGNKAVLLTQGGDFKQIRNKNYNVGDRVKVTTNYAVRIGSIAAAVAVFAIGGVTSYFMPASYVSVDINPSFLMTLNVYDKVISIEPLNDEAKTVLKHTDVKGMDINETVEAIINESRQEGYINDAGGEVIVSVVPGIRTPRIEDKNTKDNINLIVNTSDKTELDEARDMGVSIAKAKAIEDYTGEFGGTVSDNAGKLSGKTVKQIENEIAEKKAVSPTKPAQTASPQPNIDVTLQSAPQPALPAESKSVQRQSAKAAPNPTAASAQIFMPQQIFTLSPAKGNDENNSYNEKKAEGVKPEIKQETPKA